LKEWFTFPNPVNEVAARVVAAGVVALSLLILATGWTWLVALLAYGFVARVAAGPRFSPLALLATRLIVPSLRVAPRPVPGPPKRFAQAIGATLSVAAAVAHFGFAATGAAQLLVGAIAVAATLEAALGFCLGCAIFARLMRLGVIPDRVCAECANLSLRT
jgi:hypothetical protein